MPKTIIGIMGPGSDAKREDVEAAYELGSLIATEGWVLLTGGRNEGVMHSASRGAKEAGGLTVGILPSEQDHGTSEFVDIPVYSGMGQARNNINILSSQIVVSCGLGLGTLSELALALKCGKPVIILNPEPVLEKLLTHLPVNTLHYAATPSEVVHLIKELL